MKSTAVWARPEPGLYEAMSAEEYHLVEAMSASGLTAMLRSPQHFRCWRDNPSEPTEAMQFGTAVHMGVLEPQRFAKEVILAPEINRRTKEGKALWEQFQAGHVGKLVLELEAFQNCQRAVDAVRSHPAASRLLEGGKVEQSVFWSDAEYGVPCKARVDVMNHGGIADLKTTKDASPEAFAQTVARFAYHAQGAHYVSGAEHVLDATPAFFALIAVESEEPFGVKCYTLPAQALHMGRRLVDRALAMYRRALDAKAWPGYSVSIDELQLPRWALRDDA